MNDRYLYRAKRTDNGKWITWNIFTGIPHGVSILEDTACACTGLKDKNGKLIWENDIVWDSEERKFYQIIFSQEDMCYYEQDADGYKHTFESCYGSSIEVESNIFDNPELLEVGE